MYVSEVRSFVNSMRRKVWESCSVFVAQWALYSEITEHLIAYDRSTLKMWPVMKCFQFRTDLLYPPFRSPQFSVLNKKHIKTGQKAANGSTTTCKDHQINKLTFRDIKNCIGVIIRQALVIIWVKFISSEQFHLLKAMNSDHSCVRSDYQTHFMQVAEHLPLMTLRTYNNM